MSAQESRRSYEITLYDGRDLTNRQLLSDELDMFWTYAPEIIGYESRGPAEGQVWEIEAKIGFNQAWRQENELKIENTVRKSYREDNHGD